MLRQVVKLSPFTINIHIKHLKVHIIDFLLFGACCSSNRSMVCKVRSVPEVIKLFSCLTHEVCK